MFNNYSIIDDHIHYALPITYEEIENALDKTNTDKGVLVTVPDRNRVLVTPEALAIKARNQYNYYVFTSLDVSEYFKHSKNVGKYFAKYVDKAIKFGCDGVKIIEGKPEMRKMLPVPDFDNIAWEDFWKYAEENHVPILWHVNDPEEFWDINRIPSWAKERGWFYDDSYVNNEEQYKQVLNVLDRHPKLKITFAHFFFLSNSLDRLQEIFDKYENVAVDLTPGIEMYINFSKNKENTRDFFIKNSDRILYGTDIGARSVLGVGEGINIEESVRRSDIIKNFLTSKGSVTVKADGNFLIGTEDFELSGIDLPNDVLQKIFSQNFIDRVGEPRKINKRLLLKECRRIKITIKIMSFIDKNIKPDYSYVNSVIAFFKKAKEK